MCIISLIYTINICKIHDLITLMMILADLTGVTKSACSFNVVLVSAHVRGAKVSFETKPLAH